jgi:hypothetical protein
VRRLLSGAAAVLLGVSLTACADDDKSSTAGDSATTAGQTSITPTPTPTPTTAAPSLGSTQNAPKALSLAGGQLDACDVVTADLLGSDLAINGGRAGRKASSLGDPNEVLDCLYQGDAPGEANVVVRASLHADRDLPAERYPLVAGAEPVSGADRGWVHLYDLYHHTPQAQVLLVAGQVGFYIDISSENYRLDVDNLQQFAQDILQALH